MSASPTARLYQERQGYRVIDTLLKDGSCAPAASDYRAQRSSAPSEAKIRWARTRPRGSCRAGMSCPPLSETNLRTLVAGSGAPYLRCKAIRRRFHVTALFHDTCHGSTHRDKRRSPLSIALRSVGLRRSKLPIPETRRFDILYETSHWYPKIGGDDASS
jgi:hypothetical protein